ncbi:MAG TPA: hypothetical protein VGF95_07545 [Solirubrobacteraceae bacterium]|jgi:hypothetical protein
MARAVALIPDLLFGSNVLGALRAAGIEVELAGEADVSEKLQGAGVLIVDLTGELDGAGLLEGLASAGALVGVKTLGFYSHVDVEVRERAEQAGFDLVVPRSRMAREGAGLVQRLAREEPDD